MLFCLTFFFSHFKLVLFIHYSCSPFLIIAQVTWFILEDKRCVFQCYWEDSHFTLKWSLISLCIKWSADNFRKKNSWLTFGLSYKRRNKNKRNRSDILNFCKRICKSYCRKLAKRIIELSNCIKFFVDNKQSCFLKKSNPLRASSYSLPFKVTAYGLLSSDALVDNKDLCKRSTRGQIMSLTKVKRMPPSVNKASFRKTLTSRKGRRLIEEK